MPTNSVAIFWIFLWFLIHRTNPTNQNHFKIVIISDDINDNKTGSSIDGINTVDADFSYKALESSSCTSDEQLCQQILDTDSILYPITFVLDLSDSISSKIMARKMGIPSLRIANLAQSQHDNLAWKNLNEIEQNMYISILTPEATILQMIKDIAEHYQLKYLVIIYDQTFRKAMNGHSFKNSLKHTEIYWPSLINNQTIEKKLADLKHGNNHFFALGSSSMLKNLVELAYTRQLFIDQRKWYFISKEKGRFQCDVCDNVRVFISQPVESHLHHYEHEASGRIASKDSHQHIVDNHFYYDLTRFYVDTIQDMFHERKLITMVNMTYPQCGKHLSDRQLMERSQLTVYQQLSTRFMHGRFGRFIFERNGRLNYQELSMRIDEVRFLKGKPKQPIRKVAEWEMEGQLGRLYFTSPLEQQRANPEALPHYDVVTVLQAPFVMLVDDNRTTGNDRFQGYCIDLLRAIVEDGDFKFDYTIRVVDDSLFGNRNEDGEWTGMIGELYRKKADIGLAPFSVMAEREMAVDFTVPFYDLVGITIMMKKPAETSHLFKFLTVLETSVWLCILGAYFFTSFLMYLYDRISPFSFRNNRDQYKDDQEQREFTLKESLWFCMTSLTPQGGGEAPRNLSGRLVAATWWLFGFIIIASYSANLAAFLTVNRLNTPIESLDDLAKQFKIKFAPQAGTTSAMYFERMSDIEAKFYEIWKEMSLNNSLSDDERAQLAVWDYPVSDKYNKIWVQMMETQYPLTLAEAIRRVKDDDENFVFLSESITVEYAVMTNCDLQRVGNEFNKKPIALAVQQNSDLKDKLSSAILLLMKKRKLGYLKEKWWALNSEQKECPATVKPSDGVSLENIGGIYLVIIVGMILAGIALLMEHYYFKKKQPKVIIRATKKERKHLGILDPKYHFRPSNLSQTLAWNEERMFKQSRASNRNFNNFVHHY